ncbi:MAG: MMPL family transporter, partial [Candidatus Dormibacteraeota bacterium]|nr:MMPL family transporter [Candidatus Dormibacteraeota bacterium]MBO0762060.1 MMPL family transporter [Candidatus Dormibacteraeota bacterium]
MKHLLPAGFPVRLPVLLAAVLIVVALVVVAVLVTRRRRRLAARGPVEEVPPVTRPAPDSRVGAIFAAIGAGAVRFRWPVVAVWAAGTVAAVAFLPSLSSVAQSDNTGFLPAGAPSNQAQQLTSALQPAAGRTSVTVVIVRADGPLTPADDASIAQLEQSLRGVAHVTGVTDVSRSQDGSAAQVKVTAQTAQASGPGGSTENRTLVSDLRSTISKTTVPPGLQVHLAGQVATAADNNASGGMVGNQLQILSVLFVVALLLIVFRALLAPLVTVVPAFLVVAVAGPLSAEAALHGVQVSQVAQFLQIVVVIGAGTDYGLFLVFRMREELRRGLPPREAVIEAVTRVGESITFSAGTVIAALLSLLPATFGLYSGLAAPLAIGVGLMLLAGLTLLPALLAILGRAVFWPARVRPGPVRTGLWGRVSAQVVRHPVPTLLLGLAVFGGLAAAAPGYQAAGLLGGAATAPNGSDSAAGNALLARYFPQTTTNPTVVVFQLPRAAWDDPQALATAQQQLQADPEFAKVAGPLGAGGRTLTPQQFAQLHAALGPPRSLPATPPPGTRVPPAAYQAYRASGQYLSPDGRTVQYTTSLRAGDAGSTAAMNAVPAVRADADRVAQTIGATQHGVAGQAAASYDISSLSENDLRTVIPIAIVVIGILLALVLRSLVAPLYLIVSVALSYLAALGLTVLLFLRLGGQEGLIFILPFLMFVFLLALGEDYNILVMTRIREEAHRLSL